MKDSSRNHFAAGVLSILLLSSATAWASSKFLNVQGKLTDNSGNPLTGNQTVTFRLYTASTGGSAIWTESQTVALSTGLFNVSLGSVTALDSLAFTQLYYLGIQVAGDADELSPRQPLGASAYAQGSLGDFNAGNNFVAGGSVTANGSAWVGGQAVIAGTMMVKGNAFSVGGTSFTVSGGSIAVAYSLSAGQAVVSGSMTVQGSAFSVGSATFSVAGGSITLGGRLNAAAAGIRWADGTTSTTAASAPTVVINATQTFSGQNTFANLVTVSSGIHVTAPILSTTPANTLTSGSMVKGWAIFSSTPTTPILYDSMNVAAIGDVWTGVVVIYWNTPFASENYATACVSWRTDVTNNNVCNAYASGSLYYSPSSVAIQMTNVSGTGVDMKGYMMSAGRQ